MARAQVAFAVLPDGPQHYRQVERVAHLMGAPILERPLDGAVNVYTDGPDAWARARDRTRIQIAHGVADKGNWTGGFDCEHVLAPSDYLAARVERGHAHVVGIPFLDPAYDGTLTPAAPGPRPRVLYAPTLSTLWDGTQTHYSSRDHAHAILDALEPFDVTFVDHPHHGGQVTPLQAYLDADVVIADHGSTLSIAIALGKPVVLAPTDAGPVEGSIEDYLARRVRTADLDTLATLVGLAAEHGPTGAELDASPVVLAHEHRGTSTALAAQTIWAIAS